MRMTFDRDFYRPKGRQGCENLRVRTIEDLPGSEIWTYECSNGSAYAAVFGGKRAKPDWHYRFRSKENREKKIAEWVAGERAHTERMAAERAERSKPHGFEPGQLFYTSWGYDQTNINYYRLEKLKGKTMGYIVPVSSVVNEERSEGAAMYVSPGENIREWDVLLGVDRGDPEPGKWKRLTKDGFTVGEGRHQASPTEPGVELYETHPMFGH